MHLTSIFMWSKFLFKPQEQAESRSCVGTGLSKTLPCFKFNKQSSRLLTQPGCGRALGRVFCSRHFFRFQSQGFTRGLHKSQTLHGEDLTVLNTIPTLPVDCFPSKVKGNVADMFKHTRCSLSSQALFFSIIASNPAVNYVAAFYLRPST